MTEQMTDNQQRSSRRCVKCNNEKDLNEFAKVYSERKRGKDYKQHTCLLCFRAFSAAKERKRRAEKPEEYKATRKKHRDANLEKCREYKRQADRRLKDEVFEAYGGYRCVCCGETMQSMLTIDHVNNDGKEHRAKIAAGKSYMTCRTGNGNSLYRDLRKNNFPDGVQILCYNCNISKYRLGKCEHQLENVQRLERKLVDSSESKCQAPERVKI